MQQETEEYGQLMYTIYTSLEKINKLSEFGNDKNYDEFEFAHEIAHLIDDITFQVRIMKKAWNNWYYIKDKNGELNE